MKGKSLLSKRGIAKRRRSVARSAPRIQTGWSIGSVVGSSTYQPAILTHNPALHLPDSIGPSLVALAESQAHKRESARAIARDAAQAESLAIRQGKSETDSPFRRSLDIASGKRIVASGIKRMLNRQGVNASADMRQIDAMLADCETFNDADSAALQAYKHKLTQARLEASVAWENETQTIVGSHVKAFESLCLVLYGESTLVHGNVKVHNRRVYTLADIQGVARSYLASIRAGFRECGAMADADSLEYVLHTVGSLPEHDATLGEGPAVVLERLESAYELPVESGSLKFEYDKESHDYVPNGTVKARRIESEYGLTPLWPIAAQLTDTVEAARDMATGAMMRDAYAPTPAESPLTMRAIPIA